MQTPRPSRRTVLTGLSLLGLAPVLAACSGDDSLTRQVERGREGRGGLLRAGQRGGGDDGGRPAGLRGALLEPRGHAPGHLVAELREPELRQAAVEDTVGVVDFSVADQVDGGERLHGASLAEAGRWLRR